MQIQVSSPEQQTLFFTIILGIFFLASIKKSPENGTFSLSLTEELKGFAILTIVFSHIGYFLSTDTRFLFPLTILAGLGVNLFFFLSGFGLTSSWIRNKLSVLDFYQKRLSKIFIPLWLFLGIFFVLDQFILGKSYTQEFIIHSFLGYYPTANLFGDINSPLWYLTPLTFYYLLFPLVMKDKIAPLAPLVLLATGYLLLQLNIPTIDSVRHLYQVHYIAFPLGIFTALLINSSLENSPYKIFSWTKVIWEKIKQLNEFTFQVIIIILLIAFAYFSINSNVGARPIIEQLTSILTMILIILIFCLKKVGFRLFSLVGVYSYEIYLLHWPILSRYDILYKNLPPFLATVLYLALFLGLGLIFQKFTNLIFNIKLPQSLSKRALQS